MSSNKYYTLKTKWIQTKIAFFNRKDQNLTFKYFLGKKVVLPPPVPFEKIARKIQMVQSFFSLA